MRPVRSAASFVVLAVALTAVSAASALAGPGSSDPETFSSITGKAYFWASSPGHGVELWRTDGTAAGTVLYQEFRAGKLSSTDGSRVQAANGRLWVIANDGTHGREPWWIDPATGNRKLLKDIIPGSAGSGGDGASDYPILPIAGRTVFLADDGVHGREWWTTDGTKAGTTLLDDSSTDSSWLPDWHARVGGKLVYNVTVAGSGRAWATDGTTDGTSQISDISPGDQTYRPTAVLDGWAYMRGFEEVLTGQLYRTDGTTVELVKQINPTGYADPIGYMKLGTKLYFGADDGVHGRELWSTAGSEATTERISDINPSGNAFSDGGDMDIVRLGSSILFAANDGTGDELWKSDGGTPTRVKNINPGGSSSLSQLTVAGGKVFFLADDGTNGVEPWVSDGTKKGTFMLKDINVGGDSDPEEFTPVAGGKVVFAAQNAATGRELWVSDGTRAGTRLLKDIR